MLGKMVVSGSSDPGSSLWPCGIATFPIALTEAAWSSLAASPVACRHVGERAKLGWSSVCKKMLVPVAD